MGKESRAKRREKEDEDAVLKPKEPKASSKATEDTPSTSKPPKAAKKESKTSKGAEPEAEDKAEDSKSPKKLKTVKEVPDSSKKPKPQPESQESGDKPAKSSKECEPEAEDKAEDSKSPKKLKKLKETEKFQESESGADKPVKKEDSKSSKEFKTSKRSKKSKKDKEASESSKDKAEDSKESKTFKSSKKLRESEDNEKHQESNTDKAPEETKKDKEVSEGGSKKTKASKPPSPTESPEKTPKPKKDKEASGKLKKLKETEDTEKSQESKTESPSKPASPSPEKTPKPNKEKKEGSKTPSPTKSSGGSSKASPKPTPKRSAPPRLDESSESRSFGSSGRLAAVGAPESPREATLSFEAQEETPVARVRRRRLKCGDLPNGQNVGTALSKRILNELHAFGLDGAAEEVLELRGLTSLQRDYVHKVAKRYRLKTASRYEDGVEPGPGAERVLMARRLHCTVGKAYVSWWTSAQAVLPSARRKAAGGRSEPLKARPKHILDKYKGSSSGVAVAGFGDAASEPRTLRPPLPVALSGAQAETAQRLLHSRPPLYQHLFALPPDPEQAGLERSEHGRLPRYHPVKPPKPKPPKGLKRHRLPVTPMRQDLLLAIAEHQVVLVTGETGSGKTTQLPQFVLEEARKKGAKVSMVVTQPRRLPAVEVANRVAEERGEKVGTTVGYHIRQQRATSKNTAVTFATSGLLLQTLTSQPDAALRNLTHIVLDEVHERELFTDLLLTVLREALPRHPHLRLVLMSATLHEQLRLFEDYFRAKEIPVTTVHVPSRTYEVEEHYLEDALRLVGGSLQERAIAEAHRALRVAKSPAESAAESDWDAEAAEAQRRHFPPPKGRRGGLDAALAALSLGGDGREECRPQEEEAESEAFRAAESAALIRIYHEGRSGGGQAGEARWRKERVDVGLVASLVLRLVPDCLAKGSVLVFLPGMEDITSVEQRLEAESAGTFLVLPLHSQLRDPDTTAALFKPPPEGLVKVILATNIAEASVTLPDVVAVVDCGRVKEKSYDIATETAALTEVWVSASSATQRKGRAGRCQDGRVYRLYTREQLKAFAPTARPELLRAPIFAACLKARHFLRPEQRIAEFLSQAPQPPSPAAIKDAVQLLQAMEALDEREGLTELGHLLCELSLSPRSAIAVLNAVLLQCVSPVVSVVAVLESRDPLTIPWGCTDRDALRKARKDTARRYASDHYELYRAVHRYGEAESNEAKRELCAELGLSASAMDVVSSCRRQIMWDLERVGLVGSGPRHKPDRNAASWPLVKAALGAGAYPFLAVVGEVERKRSGLESRFEDSAHLGGPGGRLSDDVLPRSPHAAYLFYEEVAALWGVGQRAFLRCGTLLTNLSVALTAGPARNWSTSETSSELRLGQASVDFSHPGHLRLVAELRHRYKGLSLARLRNWRRSSGSDDVHLVDAIKSILEEEEDRAGLVRPSEFPAPPAPVPSARSPPTGPPSLLAVPASPPRAGYSASGFSSAAASFGAANPSFADLPQLPSPQYPTYASQAQMPRPNPPFVFPHYLPHSVRPSSPRAKPPPLFAKEF